MKNISIHELEATVHVNTVHGDYLEFVLDRASDRRDVDYYEILADMVTNAFKDTPYTFTEYGAYGCVWVCFRVPEIHELETALAIVDAVVAQWCNKFNINRMKKYVP